MSAAFTPGPWQLAGTHSARPKWFDVIDSDGRTKPYTLVTRVRLEADAHLIAAATDYHDAVERLLNEGVHLETWDALKAAHAKARGDAA